LLFSYDKLNNVISQRGKVPFVADMMVSRWAFEAMAVHQFVTNDYGQSLYKFNKDISQANVKATFLSEELRKRNAFVVANSESKNDSIQKLVTTDRDIIKNALKGENVQTGPELDAFLDKYKKHYSKVYNDRENAVDKLMSFYETHGKPVNEYK